MIGGAKLTKGPRTAGGTVASCGSSSASRTGKTQCVPECIVHRSKLAVIEIDGRYSSDDISHQLAAVVAKKAFALDVVLTTDDFESPEIRHGQAGLIQDPSIGTLDSSPPSAKKERIVDRYGDSPPDKEGNSSLPALKSGASSANRVATISTTALHNVLNGCIDKMDYFATQLPTMMSAVFDGDASTVKLQEFIGRGEDLCTEKNITLSFPDPKDNTKTLSHEWMFGIDITKSPTPNQKKVSRLTDPAISFELVGPEFEVKVGQKIGIAVYRNYEFDFDNDDTWKYNNWDKNTMSRDDVVKLFGPDLFVNIYTGEITNVSRDGFAILHDINTYKGCSGAIIFLLDQKQDHLSGDHGKAIAIHAGGVPTDRKIISSDGVQSGPILSGSANVGFTLQHLRGF
jgi:hypothetical protein